MSRMAVKIKGIVEYQGKYLLVQKWYDDNIVNLDYLPTLCAKAQK